MYVPGFPQKSGANKVTRKYQGVRKVLNRYDESTIALGERIYDSSAGNH